MRFVLVYRTLDLVTSISMDYDLSMDEGDDSFDSSRGPNTSYPDSWLRISLCWIFIVAIYPHDERKSYRGNRKSRRRTISNEILFRFIKRLNLLNYLNKNKSQNVSNKNTR